MLRPTLIAKAIVLHEDKVLLVRRSKTAPTRAFDWELPGGLIEEAEDPKVAALRELQEETAILCDKAEYVFAGTSPDLSATGFFFVVNPKHNKVVLSYEHDDYKWVTVTEAIKIVTVKGYALALSNVLNNRVKEVIVSTKALIRHNNETLILKRAANDFGAGNWDLPGGRLEPGEGLTRAIEREILEETRLKVVNSEIIFAHTENLNNQIRIRIGQTVSVETAEVVLSKEHQAYLWVQTDIYNHMNHPNWPGWGEFVKLFG